MSSYLQLGEGTDRMIWPNPDDPNDVAWHLCYGNVEAVRVIASDYIAAYSALVRMPQRRRNEIVRDIRAALPVGGGDSHEQR